MKSNQKLLKQKLQKIIEVYPKSIGAEVAKEALSYHNIESFFSDLLQHGCVSGMISSLVYYIDTSDFFDRHYSEIEEIRFELEESIGSPLQPKGDLKNWLAWSGFEETARKIADELEIEW